MRPSIGEDAKPSVLPGYILLGPVSGRADVGDLEILRPQEGQSDLFTRLMTIGPQEREDEILAHRTSIVPVA